MKKHVINSKIKNEDINGAQLYVLHAPMGESPMACLFIAPMMLMVACLPSKQIVWVRNPLGALMSVWRNWQTRMIKVHVP